MSHDTRWTLEKIRQRLELVESLVYRAREPIPPFSYKPLSGPLDTPPVGVDADTGGWTVIQPDTYWAQRRTDFMLRTTFRVPTGWDAQMPAALYLPLGDAGDFSHPEALLYIDGEQYAAADRHHQEVRLPDRWRDGRPHTLALHGWTGNWHKDGPQARLLMRACFVVQIDSPLREFLATARVSLDAARVLSRDHPARVHLLNALDEAFKILDTREPFTERLYTSVTLAHETLLAGIVRAGAPLDANVIATGHAHIDVAWLWTLGQTRQKAARTFHNVLHLMEQFPDYHFTQSQPQLYDFVRHDFPALFEGIKARVAEGRWETIGGMWVEADCNLSGPESLARQFVLGRDFFRQHFGKESPVLWLPDVFGYAWNLPQLIKQAGMDYFFTIKIGWNQYNRLPYDSFWWQGLDGTRVLTHFSPTPDVSNPENSATYNAIPTPGTLLGTWRNFKQKEDSQHMLMSFGYGDGGGGPTREMLEHLREMAAFPGLPRVRQGGVLEFFRALEAESGERLPTWNGELYFELHRGTYTTQSRNKRANRKSEFLLHDAEFLASLAALRDPAYAYPHDSLHRAWEMVCLNQFHDIIPGSSIGPVYVESQQQYAEVRQIGEGVRDEALAAITQTNGDAVLVINPSGFARSDLAFWDGTLPPGSALRRADGQPVYTQATVGGTWIAAGEAPPFSITTLSIAKGEAAIRPDDRNGLSVTPGLLENAYLRVQFDASGDISRIYDKTSAREVLPPGALANQWQAFEDRPKEWDAWDIDIYYDDKMWLSDPADSVRVVEVGPLRATLEIRRRILASAYTQRISLSYNSPRLDFDTRIDWRERHILLKAAFPVDVLSPDATYEIQWGSVQRPTHRNTSWDWARFETCAQKWVDLSEGGYGVSLLNDCKYGHDIHGSVIRISLLRSPTLPDEEADQGEHRFTYSLFPHSGRWDERTVSAAYALNDPLIVRTGALKGSAQVTLLSADQPNVVVETVKRAEDSKGLIVRLYESQRRRGMVTLAAGFPIKSAWIANLLEENQSELVADGNAVRFPIRPFQIVTIRLGV